jgi:hypothetical protein
MKKVLYDPCGENSRELALSLGHLRKSNFESLKLAMKNVSENVVERKILENESDTGIHSVEFSEWHADTLQKIDFHENNTHAEKHQ